MPRAAATNRFRIREFLSSLDFTGSSNTIDTGATDWIGVGDITFCAWINPRDNTGRYLINNGQFYVRTASLNRITCSSNNGGVNIVSTSSTLNLNQWQFILVTRTSAGVTIIYNNNSQIGTGTSTPTAATTNTFVGNLQAANFSLSGKMARMQMFNRILTAQERSDLFLLGLNPTDYATSIVRDFPFSTGAGTIAVDISPNATTPTITGATFSADVPMKARKQVNGNMVKNGDFEYAPPFTAITTTSARFIDGSAGGSTTNDLFGWYLINGAGTFGASFDTSTKFTGTASLKLEATDATGRGRALSAPFESTTTIALINTYGIPAQPSTDYILTAYVKTAGASASSVRIQALFFTADGAQSGSSNSSFQGATQDFTLVSLPFTTASTTRFIVIKLDDNTSPGAAHQAWFDDVKLLPVYPEGRVPANGNLVKNFDFEVAPTFVAAGATSARWIDGTSAGSTTNSTYKWAFAQETGTGLVQYDSSTAHLGTYSMKLSTTATGSLVQVAPVLSTNAADVVISGIRATPSTDYTLTFWMKTNYVSGDSNDGAYILVSFSDSFGTGLSSSSSTKIKTTTDWTQYTLNFTTTSLTQIIYPRLRIEGSTGTATLIMDAWFDDIYLAKTTNPGRIQIT